MAGSWAPLLIQKKEFICLVTWNMGQFSSQNEIFLMSNRLFDQISEGFRILIKKLISELTWKPRNESFKIFDRIISIYVLL